MIKYHVICVKESGILIKISKSIFAYLLILAVLLCSFGCDTVFNENMTEAETATETESSFESEIIESEVSESEAVEDAFEESATQTDGESTTESDTILDSDSISSEYESGFR